MSPTKHFCCCLPVRFGVFILSALSFLGSGFYAVALWLTYAKSSQPDQLTLNKTQKIAIIVAGVVFSLMCIASLFGFIGAVIRKRALVAFYATELWILTVVELAAGAFLIYTIFHNSDQFTQECIDNVNKQVQGSGANITVDAAAVCNFGGKTGRIAFIVSFVVSLLIQAYCALIVSRYVSQLSEEQAYRHSAQVGVRSAFNTSSGYYPHQPLNPSGANEHEMAGRPSFDQGRPSYESGYDYAKPQNSFGKSNA